MRDRPSLRTIDAVALVLLLAGGVVIPVAGWLAGVVLLWASPSWNRGRKALGTLVVPGGLAAPLLVATYGTVHRRCVRMADLGGRLLSESCTSSGNEIPVWLGNAVVSVLVAAPIGVAVYLARTARRSEAVHAGGAT
jgi:hypothetical protein